VFLVLNQLYPHALLLSLVIISFTRIVREIVALSSLNSLFF